MTIERIGWRRASTTDEAGVDVVNRAAALARSQSEEGPLRRTGDVYAPPATRCNLKPGPNGPNPFAVRILSLTLCPILRLSSCYPSEFLILTNPLPNSI